MHLHNRAAVRGNLASFHVHWDDVLERILAITEASNGTAELPHDGETLAHLVRFEFRLKDKDLSRHLKHMRLRAHVVLRLGWELIDRGHPAFCKAAGGRRCCHHYGETAVSGARTALLPVAWQRRRRGRSRPTRGTAAHCGRRAYQG